MIGDVGHGQQKWGPEEQVREQVLGLLVDAGSRIPVARPDGRVKLLAYAGEAKVQARLAGVVRPLAHRGVEFGGQYHLLAPACQRLAQQGFDLSRLVEAPGAVPPR